MADQTNWVIFFKSAGIPANLCSDYAALFLENRIQPAMLKDLTKELLNEIGVKALGDVLAILKTAKKPFPKAPPTAAAKSPPPKTTLTAAKTKTKTVQPPAPGRLVRLPTKTAAAPAQLNKTAAAQLKTATATSVAAAAAASKKRITAPADGNGSGSDTSCHIVAAVREARKALKFAPDHQEYIISMPKGSTPKSRDLLRKAELLKRNPELTATMLAKSNPVQTTTTTRAGIFARLGSDSGHPVKRIKLRRAPSPEVTSTTGEWDDESDDAEDHLTLRQARFGLPVKRITTQKKTSIEARLGALPKSVSTSVLLKKSAPPASSGIFARLG